MACPTSTLLLEPASPLAAVAPIECPAGAYARFGKRALDLALTLAVLPVALLFGLPIGAWNLVVFRDPRRVFFVQERVGLRGRGFRMVKFRTMRDPKKSAVDSWFNGDDAARVTRFGRLLRNTHLDELPQLLNVLKGDMHLVGPRPEMPDVHDWACEAVPGFASRLAVRPGLTGRAQVTQGYTGASAECYERKLAIDVKYITQLTLGSDIRILARTIPWVLQGRGWSWKKGCGAAASQAPERAKIQVPVEEIRPVTRPADALPAQAPAGREYAESDAA